MAVMSVRQLPVSEAREAFRAGAAMVDVREPDEWEAGHVPGALHIPLSALRERLGELPESDELLVICRSGSRSDFVADALAHGGRSGVANVAGGMHEWVAAGFELEPDDGIVI
jgi:rhodanese-related sulfurtransferase